MMNVELLQRAILELGGQEAFGRVVGVSRRTVNRWGGSVTLLPSQLADLVQALYPRDATLAQQIAADARTTLEALGVRVPQPPPPPPPPPPPHHAAESVLCAAAEAFDASPRVVRPLLLAAVDRALEMNLTLQTLATGLRPRTERTARQAGSKTNKA